MPNIQNKGHFKEYTRTEEEQRLYDVEKEVAELRAELAALKADKSGTTKKSSKESASK